MDIRNRMDDVVTLRTHALQDFLRLILDENWRNYINRRVKDEVENNGSHKSNYISAYEKIRDIGLANYDVEDMDVSFIYVVINFCPAIAKTMPKTREALRKLTEDRNATGHSSANESKEELYRRGLFDLNNLQDFIKTVDTVEIRIDESDRLAYRQKYIKEIDKLMELLDNERIELIQRKNDLNKDIQRILSSDNPFIAWHETMGLYMERFLKQEKDYEKYAEFIIAASDAGIAQAHDLAIHWFIVKNNYPEAERRVKILFDTFKELSPYEAKSIIDILNTILLRKKSISEEMKQLVEQIRKQGYSVEVTETGLYDWIEK